MARLPNDDYDGAWKAALGVYLQEFLALCFPAIHAAIDWTRPYRFLETEWNCVSRTSTTIPITALCTVVSTTSSFVRSIAAK